MSDYRFPVEIAWPGGRHVLATVPGKPPVEIATPPEFNGDFPDLWSPEDFLVAAIASCYAVTLIAIADRSEIPLHALAISAEGAVGREGKEPFGFKAVRLQVSADTDPGREGDLHKAAKRAEQGCLVSAAVRIPVHLNLSVETVAPIERDLR